MIDAFYTASSGVVAMQKNLDIVANNTANVSTDGFVKACGTFADLLYTNIHAIKTNAAEGEEAGTPEASKLRAGHGVKLDMVNNVFTEGNLRQTGRPLDHAIGEDGFFAVETTQGIKYTRAGSFHLSEEDEELFVVNMNGDYVLDADEERITIEKPEDNIPVGVFSFRNNDGLQQQEGLYFTATTESGEAEVKENPRVLKNMLTSSNTDLAQTMADMIQYQRAFQFNSKLVQAADEVMQTVNSLRQ